MCSQSDPQTIKENGGSLSYSYNLQREFMVGSTANRLKECSGQMERQAGPETVKFTNLLLILPFTAK